ncbi:putative het domain-containing protein [Botrytis fragariae]|uniref:Putative het domain-containing protein n=1 Tax=Botrytis fragariae TaxID=1964551 RepID=A0A8H6EHY7_9HELO|nr:putative het domain-containing protein [Botrytis fragariae]KAF5872954.1 putative het domain-containing protein [Botrytis fragariae]
MTFDSTTTCKVCSCLNNRDHNGNLRQEWVLELDTKLIPNYCLEFQSGSVRSAARSGCPYCSIILRGLRIGSSKMQIFDDSRPYNGRFVIRNDCSLRVELQAYYNRESRMVPKLLHWGLKNFGIQTSGPKVDGVVDLEFYSKSIQENTMHVKSALVSAFGIARDISTFNSIQRSASIMREWIANCDSQHTKCASRANYNAFPTRVLDVCQLRRESAIVVLVEKTDASFNSPQNIGFKKRYATLSHCWGDYQPLQTKRESFRQHRKGIAWKTLPLTFRDAISIVRALGIRHIWIDSLCIVQDDQDDWEKEAARMAIVYSNSYLNLAATAGLWQSDIARGLLWSLRGVYQSSSYNKNEQDTSQDKTTFACSWSWASALFKDGGIITFPATQDSTFKPHECFSYIGTNLPTTAAEILNFPEMDIPTIRIQGLGVAGEIAKKLGDERGVTLNFGNHSAKASSPETIISLDFYNNLHNDHATNESTKVLCIVVGTMRLRDPTAKLKTASWICTLLCKLSSRRPEYYERVGVFDIREDTGVFQDADKMTIDLI